MAINGVKDMSLSPSEQIGFEMTLLRMLAFHSELNNTPPTEKKTLKITPRPQPSSTKETPKTPIQVEQPKAEEVTKPAQNTQLTLANQQEWEALILSISFVGGAKMLIKNTVFDSLANNTLTLTLDTQFANLLSEHVQKSILESLRATYTELTLVVNLDKPAEQTLAQKETQANNQYLATIQQEFLSDEIVQKLEKTFNARVDVNSIREITKH
jgi:DNA polymerase-3 subunit gamma/tau